MMESFILNFALVHVLQRMPPGPHRVTSRWPPDLWDLRGRPHTSEGNLGYLLENLEVHWELDKM